MLTEEAIRSISSPNFYTRGKTYYRQRKVRGLKAVEKQPHTYMAEVRGTRRYRVQVKLSEDESKVEGTYCSCPLGRDSEAACKHVVATLLAVKDMQEEGVAQQEYQSEREALNEFRQLLLESGGSLAYPDVVERVQQRGERVDGQSLLRAGREMWQEKQRSIRAEEIKHLFDSYAQPQPRRAADGQMMHLEPRLFVNAGRGGAVAWLEFRLGAEKLYVLKNILDFMDAYRGGHDWPLGKKNMLHLDKDRWGDARSGALWQMLEQARNSEQGLMRNYSPGGGRFGYYYGYSPFGRSILFDGKRFKLSDESLVRFLDVMGEAQFELTLDGSETELVRAVRGNPRISLELAPAGEGGIIRMDLGNVLFALDSGNSIFYQDGKIFRADENFRQGVLPLMRSFMNTDELELGREELGRFFALVLPRLEKGAEVEIAPGFEERYIFEPLTCELYLDYEGDGIAARPVFVYGDVRFNPLKEKRPKLSRGLNLVRNESGEQEIFARFANYGFTQERGLFVQRDEEQSYDFLVDELPNLPEWVEIFYEDAFQEKPVRQMPKVTAGVSVNDANLLEVSFSAKDLNFDEMLDILASYRQKKRYHRLKDRTFVTLGEQQLQALADFVESTGLTKKKIQEGEKAVLPLAQAMYIDQLARDQETDISLKRNQRFRQLVRNIRSPQDADYEVPESLASTLRDYQVTGYNWLQGLSSCGLGGILADDMGLGKTLQVLALLLAKHQEDRAAGRISPPSLVVAPTSLMYNWLDEVQRFTPELKAMVVAGAKTEREATLSGAGEEPDLLITTYNMLKRDIDIYEPRRFRYVILDEAQHIKNPGTQNAKSVKRLNADGFFALTGTPIENTLTELWSIFDYLMPGYLLSQQKFKAKYETPIVRDQDERAGTDLRRHIMPFILRRLKKDVLQELPDKVERRQTCEMTSQQDKVYKAWFLKSQKEFAEALKEKGFGESKIKILAILTRLRQIACDPSLFLEDYEGGSGKLDALEEMVRDAVEAGHRLLIFSQFTTMLSHIARRLEDIHLQYFYLDGATPAMERMRLVKVFNAGGAPVFLISLKAGGTGLNLTGADMVIHADPWWNPAVEDQATDRAYRLGQKNNVQVVKLITKDTVEEKIYELQQKKKDLIDKMIQPGENFLTKLSEEEIRELFSR